MEGDCETDREEARKGDLSLKVDGVDLSHIFIPDMWR